MKRQHDHGQKQKEELLFLKKKKQKNFYLLRAPRLRPILNSMSDAISKSFLLLFFKNEVLLSLRPEVVPLGLAAISYNSSIQLLRVTRGSDGAD
jgi:hypothetical protein